MLCTGPSSYQAIIQTTNNMAHTVLLTDMNTVNSHCTALCAAAVMWPLVMPYPSPAFGPVMCNTFLDVMLAGNLHE